MDGDGVVVSTIKKCEDDDSVIVRLYEETGKSTKAHISWFSSALSPKLTDMLEYGGTSIEGDGGLFTVDMPHHSIQTLKFDPGIWKIDRSHMEPPHAPSISPKGGVYREPNLKVTMTTQSPGAYIHYTTDGSDPLQDSPVYLKPLTFDSPVTLRARTFRGGLSASITSEGDIPYRPVTGENSHGSTTGSHLEELFRLMGLRTGIRKA